jgi:hypothetical protein
MNKRIRKKLELVVNKKCWGITAGYPIASIVNLHFGKKIEREKEFKNKNNKYELYKYYGEYIISIYSDWRLQTKIKPITGSCEPNIVEGPMIKGLERLINKKINDIQILDECGDLLISFGNLYLKVFCNFTGNEDNEYCFQDDMNWTLSYKENCLIKVERGCKIVCNYQ